MSTGFERIGRDYELQDHWIRRLVAFIIDSIIVSACTLIITAIVAIFFILLTGTRELPWYVLDPFSFPLFTGILSVLYFTLIETYYESTFGKRLMNLKTIKLDGEKVPLDLAFIRNISKIYWVIVLLDTVIGLATPGEPHQRMADRLAGTTVSSTGTSPWTRIAAKHAVRFCPYCGRKLPKGAKYCSHCGRELGNE